jgi:hypothetical protein
MVAPVHCKKWLEKTGSILNGTPDVGLNSQPLVVLFFAQVPIEPQMSAHEA